VRLTADAFLAWAEEHPDGRFELLDGEVVAMAPERRPHVRAKYNTAKALEAAIAARSLPCEMLIDGMGVRVDEMTMFVPDVIVHCGPPPPNDAMEVRDPVILVEVLSPTSQAIDSRVKLARYFQVPSLRHYLVIDPETRAVTYHSRDDAGGIAARTLHEGGLRLDPPGIDIEVGSFFVSL
jgi:Uma2 family endonuclease